MLFLVHNVCSANGTSITGHVNGRITGKVDWGTRIGWPTPVTTARGEMIYLRIAPRLTPPGPGYEVGRRTGNEMQEANVTKRET